MILWNLLLCFLLGCCWEYRVHRAPCVWGSQEKLFEIRKWGRPALLMIEFDALVKPVTSCFALASPWKQLSVYGLLMHGMGYSSYSLISFSHLSFSYSLVFSTIYFTRFRMCFGKFFLLVDVRGGHWEDVAADWPRSWPHATGGGSSPPTLSLECTLHSPFPH